MMARTSFSRDELLTALQVIMKILQAFPDGDYLADGATVGMRQGSRPPREGQLDGVLPPDGTPVRQSRGVPQPARKHYTLAAKPKIESVDWAAMPPAARKIADHLLNAPKPQTSHQMIKELKLARSTFANAMTALKKRKLVQVQQLRG